MSGASLGARGGRYRAAAAPGRGAGRRAGSVPPAPRSGNMNILLEFFVVTFRVLWAFVLAAAKWLVRPKEKSVAGQVCLITGAGSGLGRLFALEFARRRALLVLWDINTQSNEETAGMVRHIYREMAEQAAAAAPGGKRRGSPRCPRRSPARPGAEGAGAARPAAPARSSAHLRPALRAAGEPRWRPPGAGVSDAPTALLPARAGPVPAAVRLCFAEPWTLATALKPAAFPKARNSDS